LKNIPAKSRANLIQNDWAFFEDQQEQQKGE